MKYEIDGIKKGITIKNYKVKSYYSLRKLKLIKKYHFKINFLKGKSANLYTTNIEDVKDVIKVTEDKMLKQLKALLKNEEITKNSALKYLEKKLNIFNVVSLIITATMPTIFILKYNNINNLFLIIPNLLAKFYYTISIGIDYTNEFYSDIQKYNLYLENEKLFNKENCDININNIDNYDLNTIKDVISELQNNCEKKLVKRR